MHRNSQVKSDFPISHTLGTEKSSLIMSCILNREYPVSCQRRLLNWGIPSIECVL